MARRISPAFFVFAGAAFIPCAGAQEIRLVSEFQRFDPYGSVLQADREVSPREVLSPAVPRNGHLSFHIVVTAPANTNYFLYVAANPPDLIHLALYREHWSNCGTQDCGDWLTALTSPAFGAIPESLTDRPGQNTRNYLLDIYVPKDTAPRRIRVEALLKVGIWIVAPLEVRVIQQTVPDTAVLDRQGMAAPVDDTSSRTAHTQLLRFTVGLQPTLPASTLRVRDIIQRNAAEDMWLATSLGQTRRGKLPELNALSFAPFTYPDLGSEWYLRVRDFLYRFGL